MHVVLEGYQRELSQALGPQDQIEVVTAERDLPMGTPLTSDVLSTRVVPRGLVNDERVYTSPRELIGEIPRAQILTGEIVRRERLVVGHGGDGLDELIEPGNRALTVEAKRDAVVAGLLEPGNWIDVIVTIRPDSNELNANWVTETILQGVQVLAVGTTLLGEVESQEDDWKRQVELVTLEVTPEEAEKLALASARGDLHLSLRSEADLELDDNRGPLVTNALVGLTRKGSRPRRRPARRAKPETAEVIGGSSTRIEEFDSQGKKLRGKER